MKLKEYLKKHGLKQKYFAQKIGISPVTLSSIIRNGRKAGHILKRLIEYETEGEVKVKDWEQKQE